jgi:hypothetical protein
MKKTFSFVVFTLIIMAVAPPSFAQSGPYQYYSLTTPCRLIDTRNAVGTNGGPALSTGTRDFQVRGNCGVPFGARAISVNVTIVNASASSWLTLWPSGATKPFVSTINFDPASGALANGAILGVSANANDLSIANAVGSVNVILDVTGYFM